MHLTPVKMRRLEPPQDDLFGELIKVLPPLEENDVVVVASKVVAIHEGRSVPAGDATVKARLVEEESDAIIKTPTKDAWNLTVKNHMVTFAGGVDESNAGEYMLLLPENPTRSAFAIRKFLRGHYGVEHLGVIITDSSAMPFRQGVLALAIGFAGFEPTQNYTGATDLFGRPFVYTYVNVADSIAVAAGFVMGETSESTPVCIVRDIPRIVFTEDDKSNTHLIDPKDDVFYPLFKDYL